MKTCNRNLEKKNTKFFTTTSVFAVVLGCLIGSHSLAAPQWNTVVQCDGTTTTPAMILQSTNYNGISKMYRSLILDRNIVGFLKSQGIAGVAANGSEIIVVNGGQPSQQPIPLSALARPDEENGRRGIDVFVFQVGQGQINVEFKRRAKRTIACEYGPQVRHEEMAESCPPNATSNGFHGKAHIREIEPARVLANWIFRNCR